MMDDPDFYVSCLRESYEELYLAASEVTVPVSVAAANKKEADAAAARMEH
jgi:hypothetical protein